MNIQRIAVLGLALVAACAAAFLVRGMMGGGTPAVIASAPAPTIAMSEILVAGEALQPGQALDPAKVRWEQWPASAVKDSFIKRENSASLEDVAKNRVVRMPLLAGQPIATNAVVDGKASGFMAAMLAPGMRAVSIVVSAESGAGGFILPNDRVDLIVLLKSNDNPPRVSTRTFLRDVRVLAVDQVFKEEKDQKTVLAKTATLELTSAQAETVSRAQGLGQISLALRPLSEQEAVASNTARPAAANDGLPSAFGGEGGLARSSQVAVIRYGIIDHPPGAQARTGEQRPQ